jgi:hypothetical protein
VAALCLILYIRAIPEPIKWAVSSVYQVPKCTKQIADEVGIKPNFSEVKEYIISSVKIGMTLEESKETLAQFGEVSIVNTFTFDDQDTDVQVLVKLCENPFGNVLLDMYYSKDGYLINILDSNPQ